MEEDEVKKPTLFAAVGMAPPAVIHTGGRQTKREQRKVVIMSVCLLQSSYPFFIAYN
jgi:hypothetical protein